MIDYDTKNILEKSSYDNIRRYISGNIIEYDIKSANISIMLDKGIIQKDYYNYLSNLPKNIREKEVGLLEQKDISLYDQIKNAIIEYKLKLAEANDIKSYEIVRVANDAVYINRPIAFKYTDFGLIHFKISSPCNVYLKIYDIKLFIKIPVNGDEMSIDVKGINDNNLYLHNKMIEAIVTVVFLIERSGSKDAIQFLSNLINNYICKNLDIEYYREFNNDSSYRIRSNRSYMLLLDVDSSYINNIDINYNLYILRELWSIVLELYDRDVD